MIRFISLLLLAFMCCSQGCSVGMAMSGNEQRDMSVVFPGAPRAVLHAKLGPPEMTTTNEDGLVTDSWLIVKGNAPSGGRAALHAGMDVLTLGIWEIIGTPLEMGAAKEVYHRVIVVYDKDGNVKTSQAIQTKEP